ncbi:hypothetical protein SC1083_2050 [Aggregatibacter actinomycetemcomitans serotype e str. SC1083]|uniref:Uncharacterized protein n=1 Tax=Aggregatibacter actinomycetemcomitans serotype e str. SC1083 TaxID=907488 RepID=G4AB20_AGGAC|nr:hypothetical protein SC1083_2050 [Aggregatibacter actinomycetemcomitans serotype e str. SC1083]
MSLFIIKIPSTICLLTALSPILMIPKPSSYLKIYRFRSLPWAALIKIPRFIPICLISPLIIMPWWKPLFYI